MKMQAKNFDSELLRLHPNRGHGVGIRQIPRAVSHKIKLKETRRTGESVITSETASHVRPYSIAE